MEQFQPTTTMPPRRLQTTKAPAGQSEPESTRQNCSPKRSLLAGRHARFRRQKLVLKDPWHRCHRYQRPLPGCSCGAKGSRYIRPKGWGSQPGGLLVLLHVFLFTMVVDYAQVNESQTGPDGQRDSITDLSSKTVAQLKDMLRDRGLSTTGHKAALVGRLQDVDEAHEVEDAAEDEDTAPSKPKKSGGGKSSTSKPSSVKPLKKKAVKKTATKKIKNSTKGKKIPATDGEADDEAAAAAEQSSSLVRRSPSRKVRKPSVKELGGPDEQGEESEYMATDESDTEEDETSSEDSDFMPPSQSSQRRRTMSAEKQPLSSSRRSSFNAASSPEIEVAQRRGRVKGNKKLTPSRSQSVSSAAAADDAFVVSSDEETVTKGNGGVKGKGKGGIKGKGKGKAVKGKARASSSGGASASKKQPQLFAGEGEVVDNDGLDLQRSVLHCITWNRIILDEVSPPRPLALMCTLVVLCLVTSLSRSLTLDLFLTIVPSATLQAHKIKSRTNSTAKSVFALRSNIRWCLSGTPLQNRISELYALIRFLQVDPYAYYFCTTKGCDCQSMQWRFGPKQRKCEACDCAKMKHFSHFNKNVINPVKRLGIFDSYHLVPLPPSLSPSPFNMRACLLSGPSSC